MINENVPRELAERLTPFVAPQPFDRAAYLAAPQEYLDQHVPGRAFQTAPEGPDIEPIRRVSPFFQRIIQGETVVLRVQGEPEMAISVYAPRLGVFLESQTSSVTVRADGEGIAEVRFTATPGTQLNTPVVASSPVNSRLARFTVDVVILGLGTQPGTQ